MTPTWMLNTALPWLVSGMILSKVDADWAADSDDTIPSVNGAIYHHDVPARDVGHGRQILRCAFQQSKSELDQGN